MKHIAIQNSNTLLTRKPTRHDPSMTSFSIPSPNWLKKDSFYPPAQSAKNESNEHHLEVISICQDFILSMESQWSGLLHANEYGPVLYHIISELKKLLATKPDIASFFPGTSNLKHGSKDHQFLMTVQGILEQNLEEPDFGVDQFADALCVSKSRLYRKLLELTGHRPNELIRQYRLLRARTMITDKIGSIKEIAYRCGFSNLSYFAKCFREQFGVLPSEVLKLTY